MEQPVKEQEIQPKMLASDLCLPIYLDQQIVFDMLAVLEDGLVNVSQVRNSVGRSDSEGTSIKASFGVRLLELFTIGADASQHSEGSDTTHKEVCETRTHTAASLLCKLRSRLDKEGLVNEITKADQLNRLSPGSFVEIRVLLQKNPVVEIIDRIVKTIDLIKVFQDTPSQTEPAGKGKNQSSRRSPPIDPNEALYQQFRKFHEQITKSESVEAIGKGVVSPEITAVVSMNRNSFVKSESEYVGNICSIFGKVANVIPPDEDGRINLLSRTTLAGINPSFIQGILSQLNEANAMGLDLPKVVTEVEGPALQIIPIAVFL